MRGGKKCYCVFGSKKKLRACKAMLKNEAPGVRVLAYCSDWMSEGLDDVHASWSAADVVLATTTITVGVNFDLEHFDLAFAQLTSLSAVPRDMAQALLRVRTLRDRRVVVTLRDAGLGGGPEPTLASLRADERARDALLRREGDEARALRACPRWLAEADARAALEAAVAGRHYRALWEHYACELGLVRAPPAAVAGDGTVVAEPVSRPAFGSVARFASEEERVEARRRLELGEASEEDRLRLARARLVEAVCRATGRPDLETAEPLAEGLWPIERQDDALGRLYRLAREAGRYARFVRGDAEAWRIARDACSLLGLRGTDDLRTRVPRQTLADSAEALEALLARLRTLRRRGTRGGAVQGAGIDEAHKRGKRAADAVLEGVGLGPLRKADTTRKRGRAPAYALGRGTTAEAEAWAALAKATAARPSFETPTAPLHAPEQAEWHGS